MPWTATLFIVARLTGARIARVGERPFAAVGLLLQGARMGWIALALQIAVLVAVFAGSGSYASPHGFSDGFEVALGVWPDCRSPMRSPVRSTRPGGPCG